MRSKISRSFVLELLSSSTAYAVPLLRRRRLILPFPRFIGARSCLTVYYLDSSFSRKDPTLRVALRRKRLGFRLRGRHSFCQRKAKSVSNNYNDHQAYPTSAPLKMTDEVCPFRLFWTVGTPFPTILQSLRFF